MWPFKKKEIKEKPVEEKTYAVVLHLKSDAGYRFGGLTAKEATLLVQKIKETAKQSIPYVPELPLAFAQDEFVSVAIHGAHFWGSLNVPVADKIIGAIKDAMPKPTQAEGDDPVRVGE